ncbi:hypothetical protein L5515_012253 [Caenorhabditis briggsae]|uniref:Peptidase S1 domain-containing protein n=1 Tax=Caenorhabditis briggsae TaxID=6238 RepID=A0AAE9ES31_CAEBR|nr:hypothetical protein L5515_012253 [Caenorhabditis briggsae]
MNRFLILLFCLLGGIWCDHRLSPGENMNLKSYCGTKPYLPLPTVPTKPSAEEHQSLKASCGTKSNLSRRFESRSIAGGKPIQGNEAPWAAKIHYPKISCSSTIISLRHIMSASHCLMSNITKLYDRFDRMRSECSGNDLIIYPESSELTARNSNGKLLSDKVSKIIMMNFCLHPNARYDDMMIWELSENIPFDDYAYPACISSGLGYQKHERPRNQDAEKWMFPGKMISEVTELEGLQISDSKSRRYNKLWLIVDGKRWGVQARPGDSGGSLMHYVNGQFYVIGVISHGWDTFMLGTPSVHAHYTRICQHTGIC